jgi:hypothetical protein
VSDDDNESNLELAAIHEHMKDTGFSVYSNPKFLYIIGKICVKSHSLFDLAFQSFNDYLMIISYYKDYLNEEQFHNLRLKTLLWVARILFLCNEKE